MDDLYAILRVAPNASASEIESRLGSVSTYEAARIRAILLVEARRKAYDKAHLAMKRTSVLRNVLGVTNTANWSQSLQNSWSGEPDSKQNHRSASSDPASGLSFPSLLVALLRTGGLWFIVGLILTLFLVSRCGSDSISEDPMLKESSEPAPPRDVASVAEPTPNTVALAEDLSDTLPRPQSGTVFKKRGRGVAPLKVTVPDGQDYYIKVVDPGTRVVVRSFYVRGADTKEVMVPYGTYHVYVNTGVYWYGLKKGFGPQSRRSRLDKDVEFVPTSRGSKGKRITLRPVVDGNLRQEAVDQSVFDGLE